LFCQEILICSLIIIYIFNNHLLFIALICLNINQSAAYLIWLRGQSKLYTRKIQSLAFALTTLYRRGALERFQERMRVACYDRQVD
jgi:hypothetical protein